MTLLLALLYPLAIQYRRGGLWMVVAPLTVLTLLIDVVANYTELALLLWDAPRKGEHTLSVRLRRLQVDVGWRGKLARPIVAYTNYFDPTGIHI